MPLKVGNWFGTPGGPQGSTFDSSFLRREFDVTSPARWAMGTTEGSLLEG